MTNRYKAQFTITSNLFVGANSKKEARGVVLSAIRKVGKSLSLDKEQLGEAEASLKIKRLSF